MEIGGKVEVVMKDGTRCDILTATHAIEVDFAKKWAEAIGQKETEVNYKNGKRFGVFKEWDENGTLIRTGRSINPPRLIRPAPISNQSTPNPRRIPPPPLRR